MEHRPLFFLTDFGHRDAFAGVMKAVVLARGFRGALIDLTHGVPPQDIAAGALELASSLPYLPANAVVCAVVDPGVGGARRAIALRAEGRFFVGPDNGILNPVYEIAGAEARELAIAPGVSSTFHGRDVFAPAAADLAMGSVAWEQLGAMVHDPVRLIEPPVEITTEAGLELTVLSVDGFGNLQTNLRRESVPGCIDVYTGTFSLKDIEIGGVRNCFSDVEADAPVAYFNSAGRLEIAIRNGNAANRFVAALGTKILWRPDKS